MTPDRLLKRYFPALTLVLIAVVAYLHARAIVQLAILALSGRSDRGSSLPPRHDANPPAPTAPKSGQVIVGRNPFDSSAGPLGRAPSRGNLAIPTNPSDPLSWPVCQDVRAVIVTESSDPWWSLATLQGPGEPRARARRVGDGVASQQVAFIGYNPKQQAPAVWLQGTDTLCQAMLFRQQPEPVKAAPDVLVAAASAPISLSQVRSVRVVPEQKNGKLVGIRLFGIKPGSLLSTLGLKNGDRLESVNGFEVANPKEALEAYARLRTAQRLHVRLERSGKPLELDLNIM